MENKIEKINHYLIAALILAQPFIVMIQAMVVSDIQIFGFSLFEFFNIILTSVSCILSMITLKNKKQLIKFIPYVVLLGTYFVLHGLHIYGFNHEVYELQKPNFLVECYYLIRTFIVPLLLIFDVYYSGMKKESMYKIFTIFMYIITVVMVLTNIFKVAQRTYSDDFIFNTLNIFDWFSFENVDRYSYYELTTKGWFFSGNQMASILFMTYPLTVYIAYAKRNWVQNLLVLLQGLSLLMLGTRTANMGCMIVLIVFGILWLLFKLLRQPSKGILIITCIGLILTALFPYSPIAYKTKYENGIASTAPPSTSESMLDEAINTEIDDTIDFDFDKLIRDSERFKHLDANHLTEDDQVFVRDYLAEFYSWFGISPYILEHYNGLNHSAFWTHYMQTTPNNDYRVLKTMILEDIYENNNRPSDKYLGLGYTLDYIYTEADYSYQYYLYGLLGIVCLIVPYFLLLAYVVFKGLTNFKTFFNLETAMYFIGPVIGLGVAKFSGHVLERVFPLLNIAFLLGLLLIHVRDTLEEKNHEAQ